MIKLSHDTIAQQTKEVEAVLKSGKTASLPFATFIKKTSSGISVPDKKLVRVAKGPEDLKRKDFRPAMEFEVETIYADDGTPMWFDSSQDGVKLLGMGYVNGDSRYPSEVRLDSVTIHGIAVGVTGHGKSVLLNSIILSIMRRYAPWEVELVMADAKLTEFLKYTSQVTPPHISALAATSDPDYIISVLEFYKDRMKAYQAAFGLEGESNISGFRRKTGLIIPRTVLIIDEVTEMLKNAGQAKASKIEELFGSYTALGRSAGVHLILCSQTEQGISETTLSNMSLRASLGALPKVSEKILGNSEASINYGTPGKLIVNTNAPAQNKKDNIHFSVPYPSDEYVQQELKMYVDRAQKLNWSKGISSYSEVSYLSEKMFVQQVEEAPITVDSMILGEPCFVATDPRYLNGQLTMTFDKEDRENICIFSPVQKEVVRMAKVLTANFRKLGNKVGHVVISSTESLVESIDFSGLDATIHIARSVTDSAFESVFYSIAAIRACIEADKVVFSRRVQPNPDIRNKMMDIMKSTPHLITDLNVCRVEALLKIIKSPELEEFFRPLPGEKDPQLAALKDCCNLLNSVYRGLNYDSSQLTRDSYRPKYIWILGMDKIHGLGRNGTTKTRGTLKNVMQDSFLVNYRFITSFTDHIEFTEYKAAYRYYLLNETDESKARSIGALEYPGSVGPVQAVFFDSEATPRECVKFKKFALEDEIF